MDNKDQQANFIRINSNKRQFMSKKQVDLLKNQLRQQCSTLLTTEVGKLQNYKSTILKMLQNIKNIKKSSISKQQQFRKQIQTLDIQINSYLQRLRRGNDEDSKIKKIKQTHSQYLGLCQQRVQLAKSLQLNKLKSLKIPNRKSLANQIFKWVLFSIYNEPQSMYYWPNFKKYTIEMSGGKDFIQRIGKSNIQLVELDQKLKTEAVLENKPMIINCEQFQVLNTLFKKVRDQIQKLFKLAEIFKKLYVLSQQIKQNQQKFRQQVQKRKQDEEQYQKMTRRVEALQQRQQYFKNYLSIISQVQEKLQKKAALYQNYVIKSNVLSEELKNCFQLTSVSFSEQKCQCSIS